MSKTGNSVNAEEVAKFNKMSSEWWNPNGPVKGLIAMNSVRVPLIRDGLLKGIMDVKDAKNLQAPLKGFKILDVGCGGGLLSEALAEIGAEVTGIDPAEKNIAIAKTHLSENLKENVTYFCTSIEEFGESNPDLISQFDAVVLSEVIEHVDNPPIFLQKSVRFAKKGGSVFVTTPSKTFFSWLATIIIAEYIMRMLPIGTHEYNKFISHQDCTKMLKQNDCEVMTLRGGIYNPLASKFMWIPFTSIWYAIHAIKN